jgi:hypothetical protein
MIETVAESLVAGPAHLDHLSCAAAACDGRDAGIRAQGMVVSGGNGLMGLGEHCGGGLYSYSWQGQDDLDVTVLVCIPLAGFLRAKLLEQDPHLAFAVTPLFMNQSEAREQHADVIGSGIHGAGHDVDRWRSDSSDYVIGLHSANLVILQDAADPG